MKEQLKRLLNLLFELYTKNMKYFLPLIIAFSILINPLNTFAEELILAGGCFWCLEHDLESTKGINFVQNLSPLMTLSHVLNTKNNLLQESILLQEYLKG